MSIYTKISLGLWIIFLISLFYIDRKIKKASGAEENIKIITPAAYDSHQHLLWLCCAFLLIYSTPLSTNYFAIKIYPQSLISSLLGLCLSASGLILTVRARLELGKFWSWRAELRSDHQLIKSGLYSRMKHPAYVGVFLAMLGGALTVGEIRALIGIVVCVIALVRKAHAEEVMLKKLK